MAYANIQDLLLFGAAEMAARAAPESRLVDGELLVLVIEDGDTSGHDPAAVIDAERAVEVLEHALAAASSEIDSALSAYGYLLPLPVTTPALRDYCRHIARWHLYEDTIPEHVQTFFEHAKKDLERLADGRLRLTDAAGNPLPTGTGSAGSPASSAPGRAFTTDRLRDYARWT